MMMKQLLRHTTSLLRTALLFGAIAFVNIPQVQAQPVSITSEMPDAFETINDVTSIIGDDEYYYIQFYHEETNSPYLYQPFLGEFGDGEIMQAMDYLPFAQNRLWTLVDAGLTDEGYPKFKLKSKRGFYAYWDNSASRFKTTASETTASDFTYKNRGSFRAGFKELLTYGTNKSICRNASEEWGQIINSTSNAGYVRFAKLKPNAAHIIYYREEHADGKDNDRVSANAPTTRHYLTYSGTGNESPLNDGNLRSSTVSSRQSIIPSDKSLWTLPTAAAYHQDGLWTLEEAGTDGEFYIKKYGSADEYLNADGTLSVLGAKNELFGKYVLEDPTVNRYTRIQNRQYQTETLENNWFNNSYVAFHIGEAITDEQAANGYTIVGDANVSHDIYADLGDYTKMVISGTPNMQLRVLMNRQWQNGPLAEKIVTIGSDGKAEVDLTNLTLNTTNTGTASVRMTYIDGSDGSLDADGNNLPNNVNTPHYDVTTPVVGGFNKISNGIVELGNKSWGVNNLIYLQVDASFIQGRITKATLKATATGSTDGKRATEWGAGYNMTAWSNEMTWNTADRSITDLTPTSHVWVDKNTTQEIELDITGAFTNDADNIATILVYELQAAGGTFSNPRVELEYYPTVSGTPHLNAIKTNWGSSAGTITGITLVNQNQGSGAGARYLHHAKGDGWQVLQWTGTDPDYWYAGFYPVEVPVPNKDNFFQVLLGLKEEAIKLTRESDSQGNVQIVPYAENTMDNLYGGTFTPQDNYTNIFQYHRLEIPASYTSIVVEFENPVTGNWGISGLINGNPAWETIPANSTYYTMSLNGAPTYINDYGQEIRYVPDFTIFNVGAPNGSITITRCYFAPEKTPTSMITHNGGAAGYTEDENNRHLFQLEQVDDFTQFRLKAPDGRYVAGVWQTTAPNDPSNAEVYTNRTLMTKFTIKWFIPRETFEKGIRVNHYVRHRESYLRTYSAAITNQAGLKKQGLAFNDDPEWETTSGDLDGFRQKTNHFEITHYVKKGTSRVIEFPTVLNRNNDHIFFQRFYHYSEVDEGDDGTGMDLENLKAHVSLDTRDDGDVQYFLYNNGMVTGQKLDWRTYDSNTGTYTAIPDGGMARNEQRRFNFTNSDGKTFNVAVDVSRYSDLKYLNDPDHLAGDLREPSLTMRYVFFMNDAKDMAKKLTACPEGSDNWLEKKDFHFGRTQVPYTKFKKVGYRGEFIPVRHVFSDYWVYDDPQLIDENYLASLNLTDEELNDYLDQHLVSAVNSNMDGKIEVEIIPGNTGIRKGGYNPKIDLNSEESGDGNDADYQGFYMYDLLSPSPKYDYGNSRFIVFRYPESGIVDTDQPAYINVYLNNGGTKYQLAQYTIYFDANMATRPWTKVKNGTHYANGVDCVKGTSRDPNNLRARAGHPIAKVTFDYPTGNTYHFPSNGNGQTRHDGGVWEPGGTIANSSPVPLTFGHTNYAFDGDGCNWGSYAIVKQKNTIWGNNKIVMPADDDTYGYGIDADPGMEKAFMYIDASEQPGDICAVDFEGEFCASDKLMCSGWISGSNKIKGDTRCPGSITITIKGEDVYGNSNTIYRFCPGQIYELDDGYGHDGYVQGETPDTSTDVGPAGIDGNGNDATHVVWQQFYFEFSTDQKYERYWLEVNNNCVSSNGGDFMLDNVEVYTLVPEVEPEINTPLCVSLDEHGNPKTEMRLLKLKVDYNKLKSSAATTSVGFVFLEKDIFLNELWTRKNLSTVYEDIDALAQTIKEGKYLLNSEDADYKAAFDAALLGNKAIWKWNPTNPSANQGAGIMYFDWSTTFENDEVQPEYSFENAVNKLGAIFRYTETKGTTATDDDEQYLIFNGNYPGLPWKTDTDYYIIPTNSPITDPDDVYDYFNILSECSKASVFRIEPPYHVLGLESTEGTDNYVVCEGQIPTILLDLKGYTLDGKEVDMKDLNFDWWLGNSTTKATLANYHTQNNGSGIKLDEALANLRANYWDVNSLDGLKPKGELTQPMLDYLQSLVDAGELVLHQKSVSIPAEPAGTDDPYFYLVACPIHDAMFNQALNPKKNEYVSYFCDEPQGIRIKVGQKAPTLKTGFVPHEHGFDTYDYDFPEGTDPVLSIRLAKAAQFETVKNTVEETEGVSADVNYLWLPIRNAQTQTAPGVIRKADDDNIYLASTNDPVWDKQIYKSMNGGKGSLPVVGRIVQLYANNILDEDGNMDDNLIDAQNENNRLCVYFTENFEVREGYNYTLSLPFKEEGDVNTCDGTILINLKIVPDYEVWTGAAGNEIPDWNNDENWRRADGNTESSAGLNADELYVGAAETTSPLYGYKTNAWNYRTPKDRVFRKGFAPLYCTHVLMMSDEWGNAPVLYDALDYNPDDTQHKFTNEPFPNLRDTSTPILKFDMQARRYDMWNDTYGVDPDRGMSSRPNDLIAEMYQINSCDEIVFQPGTELRNAHLLNYNSAWVEYKLDNKRWYLLGSPLQGTIAGEWYAPTGTAQQKTTYYDPVTFGEGYDRYSPAIYQRSWDKAKAVLYEVGSTYSTGDNPDDELLNSDGSMPGSADQGIWSAGTWNDEGADEYLDRLGYRPLDGNKANVAIQGIWSNTYNDATVDYTKGGFSVMVMNHLKGNDQSGGTSIIRLPKEDTMYDYYKFSETGAVDGGTDTDLSGVRDALNRAKNRGRLKTDLLLPATTQKTEAEASIYGDKRTYTRVPIKETALATMMASLTDHTEAVPTGVSNLGYYLVENPFPCGLDMEKFFEENSDLEKKYWLLTEGGQQLVQWATTGWVSPTVPVVTDGDPNDEITYDFAAADGIVAPGQGFFVQAVTPATPPTEPVKTVDIIFNNSMEAQSRYGVESGSRTFNVVVGQAQQMEQLKEEGVPVYIDVDLNGNGVYGETGVMVDGQRVDEKEPVMVPVYEMNGDEYVLDADGNRIPVLVDVTEDVILYNYVQDTTEGHEFTLQAPTRSINALDLGLVITAQRGNNWSSALVMKHDGASNDFLPSEDTETFITSDQKNVPTVYTLCGRLATTINSIHDFRCLPLGVESASDAPCTLTFKGVELLGDSVAFYDAVERKLTPLESGMTMTVSGQTQNRYYLVSSLIQEEAAEETHLQIFSKGLTVKVIASTAEPIVSVRCYDVGGSQVHNASPQTPEYSFNLSRAGVYLIKADTENDHKVVKVIVR